MMSSCPYGIFNKAQKKPQIACMSAHDLGCQAFGADKSPYVLGLKNQTIHGLMADYFSKFITSISPNGYSII